MEEILEKEEGLLAACLNALERFPVVMLEFPEVFALLATPNSEGVEALNRSKNRLPQKYYSSLVGKAGNFFALAENLPDWLPPEQADSLLEGSLTRISLGEPDQNSVLCCRGSHQGLLYRQGPLRKLFTELEAEFSPLAKREFYFGKSYSAAICTSANISGSPNGSITELSEARAFGHKAGIPLLIRSAVNSTEKGSYPVLTPEEMQIVIERDGPGLEAIMQRFPEGHFIRR